jgi:hypothetical protein
MPQKARPHIRQGLLIGFLALASAVAVHAQVTRVDFQVVHMQLQRVPDAQYVAIRTPEAWAAVWPTNLKDPNAAPIPNIDFTHFILLIANTGVKPSSGYMNVFASVDTVPASMTGAPPSNKPVTVVHIVEIGPGNCPVLTQLTSSISYALIPQTTNEIRFQVSNADSDCTAPVSSSGSSRARCGIPAIRRLSYRHRVR